MCKCGVKSCVDPYEQMTHPIDVVAATSATYSRKTHMEKVFRPDRPILILPKVRGEKSFTLTASRMCCSPQHLGSSRLDRLVKKLLPKNLQSIGSV